MATIRRYYWTLEGIFLFGAPLKIYSIELEAEGGGSPLSYFKLNMAIEDDPNLWTRLMDKLKSNQTYQRFFLTEEQGPYPYAPRPEFPLRAYTLRNPRLFSLLHYLPNYPGPTLGIAIDKTPDHAVIVDRYRNSRLDNPP
jgi:hypothetical protein